MSVQAADTDFAVLTTQALASGQSTTAELQADEDRRILGVSLQAAGDTGQDIPEADEFQAMARLYTGVAPTDTNDTALDRGALYVAAPLDRQADATNGFASSNLGPFNFDFSGADVEWNEDVVLTVEGIVNFASNVITVKAVVWYEEL